MNPKDPGGPDGVVPQANLVATREADTKAALETARQLAARQNSGVVLVVRLSPEDRVPDAHPIRTIRRLADDLLREMSREFDSLYVKIGRPTVPAERLLRAHLLEILYSIPTGHHLVEQLDYNLLFRWFVGLDIDEPAWTPAEFAENRARLVNQPVTRALVRELFARAGSLMTDERLMVDRTILNEAVG